MNRRERRAEKARARRRATSSDASRIVAVGALWHNDQPDGFGFHIEFEDDAGDEFAQAVRRAATFFDQHAEPGRCLADLAQLATRKDHLSEDEQERAVATVFWMERRGHLKSDEFNGVVWGVEKSGAGEMLLLREDAPSEDLVHKHTPNVEIRELDTPAFERELRAIFHGGDAD